MVPRSSWSGNPLTNLVYGSKGATGVDGGAFRDLAGRGTGLRCRPCLPRSANANTRTQPFTTPTFDTDRKEANDVWYDVWACVEVQENSEKTEVEACRKALGLAKDTCEYEDRRTVLTRWVVYLGGVRVEWKKPVTFRNDEDTNAYAIGRRTDENFYGCMVDQMPRRLESISPTTGIRKFRGKTIYRTSARCEWILSRKIGGSEDITQTSPAQDPSWSTRSQPDCFQPSTVPSQSTSPVPCWSLVMCTRELG